MTDRFIYETFFTKLFNKKRSRAAKTRDKITKKLNIRRLDEISAVLNSKRPSQRVKSFRQILARPDPRLQRLLLL